MRTTYDGFVRVFLKVALFRSDESKTMTQYHSSVTRTSWIIFDLNRPYFSAQSTGKKRSVVFINSWQDFLSIIFLSTFGKSPLSHLIGLEERPNAVNYLQKKNHIAVQNRILFHQLNCLEVRYELNVEPWHHCWHAINFGLTKTNKCAFGRNEYGQWSTCLICWNS